MDQSSATGTTIEFGAAEFKANAAVYAGAKRLVDAASSCDNLDDAIATLTAAWKALETQAKNGSGYTPDREMGFGSDNAAVIAESLIGVRNTVGTTRKLFNALGK